MLDETLLVPELASASTQCGLDIGEGAVLPEPGLQHHDTDADKVRQAPPEVVDPGPAEPVAEQDGWQTQDDEQDDSKMNEQNRTGKRLVRQDKARPL